MAIQIDQRINRCARCGRMLQASADVIVTDGGERGRQLLCSQRCADELAELTRSADQAAGVAR